MKRILLLVFQCSVFATFAQNPSMGPLNKDFVEFMKTRNLKSEAYNGFQTGYIPSPGTFVTHIPVLKGATEFPVSYDLRLEEGGAYLTSVKNQLQCGSCWAFASMSSLESSFLYNDLGVFDFSENHVKQNHGFMSAPCEGGNSAKSTAYFVRGSGPVLETDDPYSDFDQDNYNGALPEYYVTDYVKLPIDQSVAKQAILDHGALFTNIYWDEDYYNADDFTYCYNVTVESVNHAVTLVGWDDEKITAGGVGAWIIKNSWGDMWGENGYFYLAYQDLRALSGVAYWPKFVKYDPKTMILGYDDLGYISSYGYGTSQAYTLVKYDMETNGSINSVGTYAVEDGAKISFELYSQFTDGEVSGLLFISPVYEVSNAGYVTFDIAEPVPVIAGSDVYFKVHYEMPAYTYPVPVECFVDNYADAKIEGDVFWMSSNGISWEKVGTGTSILIDPCLKVLVNVSLIPPSGFTAKALGVNQIELQWEPIEDNEVLVIWSEDNNLGQPENGTCYNVGDVVPGGGSVLYKGLERNFLHPNLVENTNYYYKIFTLNQEAEYSVGALTHALTMSAGDFFEPVNLQAALESDNDVTLNWSAPIYYAKTIDDDFEGYDDFSLSFGNWTQYDGDGLSTYAISGVSFPNQYYTGSFIVFNPSQTDPPSGYSSVSGQKFVACFAIDGVLNNDWLISPLIKVGEDYSLSFWARSLTLNYGAERFKVAVSTSGTDPESFTILSDGDYVEAPLDWTQFEYDLSDYAGQFIHVAIVCVSNQAFAFFLDDVKVGQKEQFPENMPKVKSSNEPEFSYKRLVSPDKGQPKSLGSPGLQSSIPEPEPLSYGVYRNSLLLGTVTGSDNLSFIDADLPNGTYAYYVTAIYDDPKGESLPSNSVEITVTNSEITGIHSTEANEITVFPNPFSKEITVTAHCPVCKVEIYTLSGVLVYGTSIPDASSFKVKPGDLSEGFYIMKLRTKDDQVVTVKLLRQE